MVKLEWWIYQMVKKNSKIYLLILTQYMNVTDRQTPHDDIAVLMHSIARQKLTHGTTKILTDAYVEINVRRFPKFQIFIIAKFSFSLAPCSEAAGWCGSTQRRL